MPPKKSAERSAQYNANLHYNAKNYIYRNAIQLRKRTTKAEQKLWVLLRNRQLNGKKFRRQHAIDNFITDFYCHECKLVVELDGRYHLSHEAKRYDTARTALLNELGITVLRFWNEEIIDDTEKVLKKISEHLD
jgi:very-short-patch-repair endonuclease